MICAVCEKLITRDEVPLKVFGEVIHPSCDILDVRDKACRSEGCMWLNCIHAGACY